MNSNREIVRFRYQRCWYTVIERTERSRLVPWPLPRDVFVNGLTREYICVSDEGNEALAYFYCADIEKKLWILGKFENLESIIQGSQD